jgi:hypothetical protein
MSKVININHKAENLVPATELGKILRHKFKDDSSSSVISEDVIEQAMERASEMEYILFEKGIRQNAKPPIEGEITPEELHQRRILRFYNKETGESWLEQDGTRITDIFRIVWK